MERRRTDNLIATMNELPSRCVKEPTTIEAQPQEKSATFTVGADHEDEDDNHDVYHNSSEEHQSEWPGGLLSHDVCECSFGSIRTLYLIWHK